MQTIVTTWFERDRAHINLTITNDHHVIVDLDWWDDDAFELVDDLGYPGFVLGRLVQEDKFKAAVEQHAIECGLIPYVLMTTC